MKLLATLAVLAPMVAYAKPGGSVVGSKHDLSVSGPGPIKAESETEVCIFCHVSHLRGTSGRNRSGPAGGVGAITNRPDPTASHRPYESSTASRSPTQPTGASRICLSCHDGTIAVGRTRDREIRINAFSSGGRIPPSRPSNLGTDLRSSHPVSVQPYAAAGMRVPVSGDTVRVDDGGEIQCTSCHDPHSEFASGAEGMFLVKPSRRSELCDSCHALPRSGSHATSNVSLRAARGRVSGFTSPSDAGCAACHAQHGADPRGRLVARGAADGDDGVCLDCHATSATRHDIGRDVAKRWSHSVDSGDAAVHDAAEGPTEARTLPERSASAPRHASCVDCHDPHSSDTRTAAAPMASGALSGVWGIDAAGQRVQPVRYEYEVCFKCHADSANQPQARGPMPPSSVRRTVVDVNLRNVFDRASPSYHPVVAPGRNPVVPGLKQPLTTASFIYCSDCHASDSGAGAQGSGPRGPHGSVYGPLLERNYETADFTVEGQGAYALCYKCHDREVLLQEGQSSFPLHRMHVVGSRTPCSACHNAHGVSVNAGTPSENAHLVDFDLSIVRAREGMRPTYRAAGARGGSCTLYCHDHAHDASGY